MISKLNAIAASGILFVVAVAVTYALDSELYRWVGHYLGSRGETLSFYWAFIPIDFTLWLATQAIASLVVGRPVLIGPSIGKGMKKMTLDQHVSSSFGAIGVIMVAGAALFFAHYYLFVLPYSCPEPDLPVSERSESPAPGNMTGARRRPR